MDSIGQAVSMYAFMLTAMDWYAQYAHNTTITAM